MKISGMRLGKPELGSLRRFGTSFGIKAKLQLAFGAVAAMTVIAAVVAIVSFSATERGFEQVASRQVPMMTDAMRLSVTSGEISAAAARFVSAQTASDQTAIAAIIAAKSQALRTVMERLRKMDGSSKAYAEVETVSQRLDANLKTLQQAISDRSQLRTQLEAKLDSVHKAHARISEQLTPIVDDSYFDVVTTAEDVGKSGDKIVKALVNDGLQLMQALVEIGSETNLTTGMLTAGALTSSPAVLALLEDRFTASVRRAQKQLAKLPADPKFDSLKKQLGALKELADFKAHVAAGDEGTARLNKIFRVHESLTGIVITLIDDLNFDLVMQSDEAVKRSSKLVKDLVTNQITDLRRALEIAAQIHLVSSLMSEGAVARETAALVPMRDRFRAAADLLQKAMANLKSDEVRKVATEILALGQGDDGVFALRAKELQAGTAADRAITENVDIQRELDGAVTHLVGEAETSMKSGTTQILGDLDRNRTLLLGVAIASLLAAAAIGIFYVQRRLVGRLTSIGDAMRLLSSGETEITIPAMAARDEMGEMARSLEVFRAGEIERRELTTRTQTEQQSQQRRGALVDTMISEFRASVTEVIQGVRETIQELEGTARSLTEASGRADQQTQAATDAAQVTCSNVVVVASAAEELGSSINEISQQTNQARNAVNRAAQIVKTADGSVKKLSEGAGRIGDVVKLIRAVADQTNLLALNATIEAARAGEAGRGFSVVASEVKGLAAQTAKATEEIASYIQGLLASTKDTVDAIHAIDGVMQEVTSFTTTIAAAIEEQSASTAEIGRNVQEAADKANELSGGMMTLSDAIEQTSATASSVLTASQGLTARSGALQSSVDTFLQKVAAA
jgi:methyl-accepting chemotaxis protein